MEITLSLCEVVYVILAVVAIVFVIGFLVLDAQSKILAIGIIALLAGGSYYIGRGTSQQAQIVIWAMFLMLSVVVLVMSYTAYLATPLAGCGLVGFVLPAVLGVASVLYAVNSLRVATCFQF
jgi:hypothetical protein